MKSYYVYAYFDAVTNDVLYIGKGKGGRLNDHINAARFTRKHSSNNHWHYKLCDMLRAGNEPVIKMLAENLTSSEALSIETRLIEQLGRRDYDDDGVLYNACKRSNDWTGMKHSASTKMKISKANSGRVVSPEEKYRLQTMNLGRKHAPRSDEWKQKQRASHLGRKDPPEGFANRSKAHSGGNNPRAKLWIVEFSNGTFKEIRGLKTWCKEQNISFNALAHTKNHRRFYRGMRVNIL